MQTEYLQKIVSEYLSKLQHLHIPPKRMPNDKCFGELNDEEQLAHAHQLCIDILNWDEETGDREQVNRLLGSLQTMLGYQCWYTLGDLRSTNRPA